VRPLENEPGLFAKRTGKATLLAFLLAVGFAQSFFGQSFTSSITGLVTDPSGAAVLDARVELNNVNTNDIREATSQTDGSYQFNNLQPATYQVSVNAPGF
jgi:protocatechuate 3,4-dioxygenase beta subunit